MMVSTSSWVKFLVVPILFSCVVCDIVPDGFEEYLESLKNDNLVSPNVNIAMYHKWKEGRQERNPFLEWLQLLLGLTTTTTAKPLTPPENCPTCTCGKATDNKIVNGAETGVNQYPWMAMLLYSGRFYCGATLINNFYVLGHCVHGFNHARITVRLLEHDRSTSKETETITRSVSRIVKHPRYSPTNYDNDIAILQFTEPVKIEGVLKAICLPTPGRSFTGDDGIVTGWGTLKEGGDVSNTLQAVAVPIISNKDCRQTGYSASRITDNMLCAGYEDGQKDSCQGDSGGPLHVFNETTQSHQIAGVVSWGEGCAKKNYPGVYARVNRYLTWIKETTADACYCSGNETEASDRLT